MESPTDEASIQEYVEALHKKIAEDSGLDFDEFCATGKWGNRLGDGPLADAIRESWMRAFFT